MDHTDNCDDGVQLRDPAYWIKRWEAGDIFWHKDTINPFLEKHVDQLFGNKQKARVFVPLCGKSVDLKWIADKGHTVVGVEASRIGIEAFFTDRNLPYTLKAAGQDIILYQSSDETIGQIFIYCADLFQLDSSVLGQFDAIWDRGSLGAIDPADQGRYSVLLKSLMLPDCRYMIEIYEYDPHLYAGPPNNVPRETVIKLYEPQLTMQVLDCIEDLAGGKKFSEHFTYYRRCLLLLTASVNS